MRIPFTGKKMRAARSAMASASTYAQWIEAAQELDHELGLDEWRADDRGATYHPELLRDHMAEMKRLREEGRPLDLADLLDHTVYRNLGDVQHPALYETAFGGTKHLVTAYLDETERALLWLAGVPEVPAREKLRRFELAWRVFGRSALLLSGGATFGFYHLGVVKALLDHGVLPKVISGSSTGAMVAAGVCARSDDELHQMFEHRDIRLDGLLRVGMMQWWRSGAALAPEQLYDVLRNNCGDHTFAEAFERSGGRILNISVSPTRVRQKPRLLTHLTAPDVLIASAALASSALPGLFPPVVLERRDRSGQIVPYIETERWVDGSVSGDLPKIRLSRLHNANHFIVSQCNPHILPFVQLKGRRGLMPTLGGLAAGAARTQGAHVADLLRRASGHGPLRALSDPLYTALTQDYTGDIDVHPRLHPTLYRKIVSNPTPQDLDWFINEGQRAVWPRLAMIRDHTRIGRTFRRVVARLRAQAPPGDRSPATAT